MAILTRSGFALPGTSNQFHTGTWRVQRPVHHLQNAPCHSACPAGENAQAWLADLEVGDYRRAWETIVSVNPIPAITGRVCHHPCEGACNRGQYDQAIAIHGVERYLGDNAIEQGWDYPVAAAPRNANQIAVVGAGPAGLSAAYHLVRQGHRVTLFDSLPDAGGTLRTALPAYRLPRDVIDRETGRILALGIDFRSHHKLGREMTIDELESDFDAVFLGLGNQKSRDWSVDGATPRDLHVGLDLLKEWIAVGVVAQQPNSVAIVGGGNTAVDLARILRRAGVADVHVITHQSLPGSDASPDDLMSAIQREVEQAIEEGVQFHDHRGIRRLILRGERVVGVEVVRMKKMKRDNGLIDRVAFEGTETILHVEQVIPAIGQRVDPDGIEHLIHNATSLEVDAHGHFPGHPKLFAGGDARSGSQGTVSGAVGDGRRAAIAIDHMLRKEPMEQAAPAKPIPIRELNLNYYEHAPRPEQLTLGVAERTGCEEIEGGLSSGQALAEARRCFSCGNCLECDNCWTLCPDSAVLKSVAVVEDGSKYVFDYDFCKGCGLCAHECPSGYITMEEEI